MQNKKLEEGLDMILEGEKDLSEVLSKNGLIKKLTKRILERALKAEMSDHLGYDRSGENNYRNGSFNKNVVTETLT